MAIGSDYPQPVTVNGFTCRNCTDVDNAKKHIDPAHPKSGPYDVNAATDPSRKQSVLLSGKLKDVDVSSVSATTAQLSATGQRLNIVA